MSDDEDELSRRELLKRSAALAALAVTGACSNDEHAATGDAGAGGSQASSGAAGGRTQAGMIDAGGSSQPGGGGAGGSGTGGSTDAGPASRVDGGRAGTDAGASGSGRATVAIVRRSDLDMAVARAVELAGGIDQIQAGQTVFIKPNAVSDRAIGTPGIRTSNEVLAAVVRLVKQRKPGRIIVGDRSARGFDTMQVFNKAGIATAAMAAGADEVYMAPSPVDQPDAWVLMQPPGYEMTWQAAGGVLALRKILEADHLINVPTCKNHRYALHSLSLKNFIGAIGDSSRDPLHYAATFNSNFEPLCRDIAVLNQLFSPLINIVDATTAVINGGPQADGSDTVRTSPGLIFASRNRVALDACAVSLIKLELGRTNVPQPDASHTLLMQSSPFQLPQLRNAAMLGLGPASADQVDLAFDDVPDAAALEMIFRS